MKCHPGDVTRCVVRLEAGEKAPIPGVLQSFTQQAVLQVKADPERIQKRIDQHVQTAKKEAANDLALEKKYREIDNEAWAKKLVATEKNHKKQLELVEPEWYENPAFVVPVTVALTLGAVAGTVGVVCQLRGCK
jgi:hypothetical protein